MMLIPQEAKPYFQVQSDLAVVDELLLMGNCLAIPTAMRKEVLSAIHRSHLSLVHNTPHIASRQRRPFPTRRDATGWIGFVPFPEPVDARRDATCGVLYIVNQALGVNGCLWRARETVYWPGMSMNITNVVSQCKVCRSLDSKQQKEPIQQHIYHSRSRLGEIGCKFIPFSRV